MSRWLGFLALTLGIVGMSFATAGAEPEPPRFVDSWVMNLPNLSVAAEWLPDGRLLVLTRDGTVHIVDPADGQTQLVVTIPDVSRVGERGALDLALHPNYRNSGKFYVFHGSADEPAKLRILRFTLDEDRLDRTGNTVRLIWENPGPDHVNEFHMGGSLEVGADNRLLLTVGDGAIPSQSSRLDNVFGKVIRLNLDGSIPPDNPFFGRPGALDEIYATGFRNPFRSWVDPASGVVWIGDVGSDGEHAHEEINRLVPGGDYGWPACEGPGGQAGSGAECPSGTQPPFHSYRHDSPGPCCSNGSITLGELYTGTRMPRALRGSLVYGDWAEDTISWVRVSSNGSASTVGRIPVIDGAKPVWISVGPDQLIYYMRHSPFGETSYELRRISHSDGDRAPVIRSVSASLLGGPSPLTTTFSAQVIDPDGDSVGYLWHFGDGNTSTEASPSHTYESVGRYDAELVVMANGVLATASPLTVQVGSAPEVRITSPVRGSSFVAGDRLALSARGTDVDGELNDSSFTWEVKFTHGNHQHDTVVGDAKGNPLAFDVPTTGHDFRGNTGYEVTVTVTDADGLTATDSVRLRPTKVDLVITTDVGAGTVLVDGVGHAAPYVLGTLVGFRHTIGVPAAQCVDGRLSSFASWSDERARSHTITVPARPTRYTANHTSGGPCADGRPVATCLGRPVTVQLALGDTPTDGDDVILGTAGPDVIDAGGGNDRVCSLGGADVVIGGDGRDRIVGGRGPDRISGGDGRDFIVGRGGSDWIDGGRGSDRVKGNQGDDVLRGAAGSDTVDGGAGADSCVGFESTRRCD